MAGFLEEVLSKLRLKEREGISQAGREGRKGVQVEGSSGGGQDQGQV